MSVSTTHGIGDSTPRLDKSVRARLSGWLQRNVLTLAVGGVLLVLTVFFSLTAEAFFTMPNILNILRQIAPTLIAAVAMTFVITTSGIDLSVGSMVALSGSLLAIWAHAGMDSGLALALVLTLGLVVGFVNGWFTSYFELPPFIVTLATLGIVRGTALLVTQGYSTPLPRDSWLTYLGQGRLGGVPVPAIIAVIAAFAGWFVFTQTPFGRYVVGLGSNYESVRRAGVNTRLVNLVVYLVSGFAAALSGVIVTARLASGSSNAGVGFELEVITAVVLGGTSLRGGRGTMLGTVLGALVLGVIANGLVLLHVSPFYVQIAQGCILLLAIFMNTRLFARFGTAMK
ncbi:ABC transporter permease [Coriobacteriia bacterium Es71-Z0120]|uniref:ABC transporter permease n=1 Tax=Parvivirga hydrogeniphila TaxID=2939460 RepID=UPI002260C956|nr:ABC transporter permease [Parvivirga hydrogeniphila]MCL4078298.1 ABC transporter permease [Parvivirga hydrogeniphila]